MFNLPTLPDMGKVTAMFEQFSENFDKLVKAVEEIQTTQAEILRRLDEKEGD